MSSSEVVLSTFNALSGAEEGVASGFLLASIYTLAVRRESTPRDVLDEMFKALPSDDTWPALRAALLEMGESG